jgi:hypothetical protein
MSHLVVGAAQFEREHRLQVFSLKHYVAFKAVAEVDGICKWGRVDDIVDFRCQDQSQVL